MIRRDPFDSRLLDRLLRCGEEVPQRLEVEILAYEEAALDPLCGILLEESWGAVHACRLIRRIGPGPAVAALIEVLRDTDPLTYGHDEVFCALKSVGCDVVDPVLAAYRGADEDWILLGDAQAIREHRRDLAGVLADCGVRDERILALLIRELEADAVSGAANLAEYGDVRALPALHEAFEAVEIPERVGFADCMDVAELEAAIETLGGELTPAEQDKLRRLDSAREAFHRAALIEARERDQLRSARGPGRNAPCPCGSGKKYKRCHLRADETAPAAPAH